MKRFCLVSVCVWMVLFLVGCQIKDPSTMTDQKSQTMLQLGSDVFFGDETLPPYVVPSDPWEGYAQTELFVLSGTEDFLIASEIGGAEVYRIALIGISEFPRYTFIRVYFDVGGDLPTEESYSDRWIVEPVQITRRIDVPVSVEKVNERNVFCCFTRKAFTSEAVTTASEVNVEGAS